MLVERIRSHNKLFKENGVFYRHETWLDEKGSIVLIRVLADYFDISETSNMERPYEIEQGNDYLTQDPFQLLENRPIINETLEREISKHERYIQTLYDAFDKTSDESIKLGLQIRIAFVETPTLATLKQWNLWKKENPEIFEKILSMTSNV